MDDALTLLRVADDGKEEARTWTEGVAKNFRQNYSEQRRAPRLANLRDRLINAVKQARKLAAFLDRDLHHIRRVASGYNLLDDWTKSPPERPKIFRLIDFDSQGLRSSLTEFAELTAPLKERWPTDTGGEHDLFSMFAGTPKQALALECWELFTWFRLGEATGTDTGQYHHFTETVYALATGREAGGDHAGLERYTKKTAKICNEYVARNSNFERLRRALAPGQSPVGIMNVTPAADRLFGRPTRLQDQISGIGRGDK